MLGLTWDRGPFFQHDRDEAYAAAFDSLKERGLIYPCYCTRADLHAASAPHRGEKLVYPGTCRLLSAEERAAKEASGRRPAMRLRTPTRTSRFMIQYRATIPRTSSAIAAISLFVAPTRLFAYQLAVVVDDAAQGVNSVVRGVDLLCSTPQQIYLQNLLGLPHSTYGHIPLLVAEQNRRLSKRDHDASLDSLLARFGSPEAIVGHIAGITGLAPTADPASPEQLLSCFSLKNLHGRIQIAWI